jgi:hypothetical protein
LGLLVGAAASLDWEWSGGAVAIAGGGLLGGFTTFSAASLDAAALAPNWRGAAKAGELGGADRQLAGPAPIRLLGALGHGLAMAVASTAAAGLGLFLA